MRRKSNPLFQSSIIKDICKSSLIDDSEISKRKKDLLTLLEDNKNVFNTLDEILLEITHRQILKNPITYLVRTKDIKSGIYYLNAKCLWPTKDGKKKEVKIYIGKLEDFTGGTKDPIAKKISVNKMRETLTRRLEEGSL